MKFKRLLAKSCKSQDNPPHRHTLPGHMDDVIIAARSLVESVGEKCLVATAMNNHYSVDDLLRVVLLSAALHDLGKANDSFQHAVRANRGHRKQALRHEWISAWLPLASSDLCKWIFNDEQDKHLLFVIPAVLGHHIKTPNLACLQARNGSGQFRTHVLCGHQDFVKTMQLISERLQLSSPPNLQDIEINLLDDNPLRDLRTWVRENSCRQVTHREKIFVALVKAMVINADVAGSANADKPIDLQKWIASVLSRTCESNDYAKIWRSGLCGNPLRGFQEKLKSAKQDQTYFVHAGCGSGKTVGAYLWAEQCAAGRKLFFCYPTTGTATQGFKDYVSDFVCDNKDFAKLLHSRSEVDMEDIIYTNAGDKDADDVSDDAARIESLRTWDVPLTICTVDQVLGLMQNVRPGLYSFPAIVNGAFVFDEIHLYDDRLFDALLGFLKTFPNLPVLLMTASLQSRRVEMLSDALGDRIEFIKGESSLENIKRYRLHQPQEMPPWERIDKVLSSGGKVLWVVNLVERAMTFYDEACDRNLGVEPVCYHSRFRYEDRMRQHKAVMHAFHAGTTEPALVIATQVCEVSLDISADLMISDVAPVPSLIQRLGRLNRRGNVDSVKEAFFLDTQSPRPYSESTDPWQDEARDWLQSLADRDVSQAELSHEFDRICSHDDKDVPPAKLTWLEGGTFTESSPLREAGHNLAFILGQDEKYCRHENRRPNYKEIARRAIPMPIWKVKNELQNWSRLGYARVAPHDKIKYDKCRGASWAGDTHVIL